MITRRWHVAQEEPRGLFLAREIIDGPFLFRWSAEAAANIYRADEAQRARHDHRAMRKITVIKLNPESRAQ